MPVPADTADTLWQQLARLREQYPDARWSPASKLHLTLVFLGATDPAAIVQIGSAIARLASTWQSFMVGTGEGGGYLGERGGVAWLELDEGRAEAARLALAMDEALASRAYERRPPRPHLTLARRVSQSLLNEVHRVDTELRTRWLADRAVLYRSHPGPGSAQYEELASFVLAGGREPRLRGGGS